jgi:hypothetical protein
MCRGAWFRRGLDWMIGFLTTYTNEVFFAHPNSFLAISSQSPSTADSLNSVFQLQTPEPDSIVIPLLPGSYPGTLASRNSTNSNDLLCPFHNHLVWTTQETLPLWCCLRIRGRENVFTEQLPSNGRLVWFRASCHNIIIYIYFLCVANLNSWARTEIYMFPWWHCHSLTLNNQRFNLWICVVDWCFD